MTANIKGQITPNRTPKPKPAIKSDNPVTRIQVSGLPKFIVNGVTGMVDVYSHGKTKDTMLSFTFEQFEAFRKVIVRTRVTDPTNTFPQGTWYHHKLAK